MKIILILHYFHPVEASAGSAGSEKLFSVTSEVFSVQIHTLWITVHRLFIFLFGGYYDSQAQREKVKEFKFKI